MSIVYGCSAPGQNFLAPKLIRTYTQSDLTAAPNNIAIHHSSTPLMSSTFRANLRGANGAAAQNTAIASLVSDCAAINDVAGCYWTPWHEPNNDNPPPATADFVAETTVCLNQVKTQINAGRVHPILVGPTFTGALFSSSQAVVDTWIAAGVDFIGTDPYGDLSLIAKSASEAAHQGVPWIIAEFGSGVGPGFSTDAQHKTHMQQGANGDGTHLGWTQVPNPPLAVEWYDANYNVLTTTLKAATIVGATSISVRHIPGGKNSGDTDQLPSGSVIIIDPDGVAEQVATTALASGSGTSTSYTIQVPALSAAHANGTKVLLMPTAATHWQGLNQSSAPPYSTFGADSGTGAGGTSISFTLPSGIVDGSLAIAEVAYLGTQVLTLSGSWAECSGSPLANGTGLTTHIVKVPVNASDSGATVSWSLTTNVRWNVKGVVVPGTNLLVDAIASAQKTTTTTTTTLAGPVITPQSDNCVELAFVSAKVPSNLTATISQDAADGYVDDVQSQTANSGNPNVICDVQSQVLSGGGGVPQAADSFASTANTTLNNVFLVTLAPAGFTGTSLKLIAVGDLSASGGTGTVKNQIASYYADSTTTLFTTIGDNVYEGSQPSQWTSNPVPYDGKVLRGGALASNQWVFPGTGHHDWGDSGTAGAAEAGATVHSPADGLKPYFDGVVAGLQYGDGLWYYSQDFPTVKWKIIHLSGSIHAVGAVGPVGTDGNPLVPVGGGDVTNKALTSNVVTLTVNSGHGVLATDTVTVALNPPDAVFDGTYPVLNVTGTTVTYNKTHANVTSAATGGTVGTAQYVWFSGQLDACVTNGWTPLVLFSDPFYATTDEKHPSEPTMAPFWYLMFQKCKNNAFVLNSHKHNYERFDMMNASGAVDTTNGIVQVVVGTGGNGHYVFTGTPPAGSLVRDQTHFGVMQLTLSAARVDYKWVDAGVGSTVLDSGTVKMAGFNTGGGTASTADDYTVSDALGRAQSTQVRVSADSIVVSDSLVRSGVLQSRATSDSVPLADSMSVSKSGQNRTSFDSVVITDSLSSTQPVQQRALVDSFPIADSLIDSSTHRFTRTTSDSFPISDGLGDTFQANTGHTFTPPAVPYPLSETDMRIGRFNRPKGVSVLKINGSYVTVEYPSDIQINQATEVYLGGHAYAITAATATALQAAGYQTDTPDSIGGTGSAASAPAGYFSQGGDPGAIGYVPFTANVLGGGRTGTPDPMTPSYNDV